jgi:hypothetical protein
MNVPNRLPSSKARCWVPASARTSASSPLNPPPTPLASYVVTLCHRSLGARPWWNLTPDATHGDGLSSADGELDIGFRQSSLGVRFSHRKEILTGRWLCAEKSNSVCNQAFDSSRPDPGTSFALLGG